jgi:molybdopterin molybdotransferase
MAALLSVADALARVLDGVEPLPQEHAPLVEADGRVLAADVAALRTQPPADLSAMDGYAVRAEDVPAAPTTLTLVGEAPAGGSYDHALKPGETVRIFTGGPLPMGADSIVIQEDTKADGKKITILDAPRPGRHIRKAGLDFSAGDALLAAGRTMTTRDAALAAAMNLPWLSVHRKPRVAILSTGDELVMPGEPVGRNQIVSSSGIAVAALVRAWGGDPTLFDIARDDPRLIRDKIEAGAQHDILITLGGASVGDHDLVQDALKAQSFAMDFWRIAMRPGKPLMHGRLGDLRVLGLPGNPTSSTVCAILFLLPLIRALHGEPDPGGDPSRPARLAMDMKANGPRQDYGRATLKRAEDGVLRATPVALQDSSLVKAMARADGLIVRSPHAAAARAGDPCRVIVFDELGI